MISETDEAVHVRGRHLRGDALLVRAGVRVRVHGGEPRAALHEAVEVERDAVGRRADLDAGDFVIALRLVVVHLLEDTEFKFTKINT